MAKILTGREIVTTSGVRSIAVPSRVVSCGAQMLALNMQAVAYTQIVGQVCRLKSVDVWIERSTAVIGNGVRVTILTGDSVPANFAQAITFENVIPLMDGNIIVGWLTHWGERHWHWDLDFEYKGTGRRFILAIEKFAGDVVRVYGSFQVEES